MRILHVLIAVTTLLVGAGCAAITEPLGMEDPFAIEQPFKGVARNDTMIATAIEVPALVVDTPAGLSAERSVELRNRLVIAARRHDVPASAEPMARAWVLSAQAATVSGSPDKKGQAVVTSVLSWRLIDAEGADRGQFVTSFPGDETMLTDSAIQLLAEQTATALDAALARPGTQALEVAAAPVKKPKAWIGTIKGAPGDGNKALARALQGILPLKGVAVEATKDKAEWRIEGEVKLEAGQKEDKVTLTWKVFDAKGIEAGSIKQQNAVAHGRLSKPWAEIAGFAAEAAAEGIAQLIQQVTKPKPA